MLRKEQHLYIARFENCGQECAKVGISHNPVIRMDGLNGIGYKHPKKMPYSLYAVFSLGNSALAKEIESLACKKFKPLFRKEYLDQHPERVFAYCWKILKERGIKPSAIWRADGGAE
ncbi:MAG: hypothetical protein WC130_03755 [Kiritimatiellia bacterium]